MKILTVQHPIAQHIEVEAVTIHTPADLHELRDSTFHDGALAVLTYPTAPPVGFVSHDNPKAFGGTQLNVGDTLVKGPAGDFEVIPAEEWWA